MKLIIVFQLNDITAKRCKFAETVKLKLLENLSRILPAQSSKSRGIIRLGRSQLEWDNSTIVAKYYVNNILYPASLEKVTSIPKNMILLEIVPHSFFQSIIADSSITLISLYKSKNVLENTIQGFLEAIGDLYNAGFQPQIASLYPTVQFPVSRGTPMISPLVRYTACKKINVIYISFTFFRPQ